MFKKVDKLLIFTAIIVIMLGISLVLMNFANIKTNAKSSEQMNTNYSTTESNTWDVSKAGDGSVMATLSEDGTLIISGTGDIRDWKSGDTIDWHGMRDKVKSVIIEEGITNIGDYAFYYCRSLTSINIPDGVTSIGDSSFDTCDSLTSINIPSSVTSIGEDAFYYCRSLTSINIPDGVTSIGDSSFATCDSLTSINIPSSVTSIGDWAFAYCEFLTSVNIEIGVTTIGMNAFWDCCRLTSINIPSSVTSIGEDAFFGCSSLTSINIGDGVTSIGDDAFGNCRSLTEINVDENNKKYVSKNGILFNKEETELILYPAKKTDKEYVIPNTVTSIGWWAFSNCSSLTSINIPDGVTSMGGYTFYDCSSLTNINIPDGVTLLGSGTFSKCSSLTSINIPNGVTSIFNDVFSNCSSLTSINIPSSVTSIDGWAFYGCSNLTIYCNSNSEAETYAKSNGISYIIDDEAPTITSVEGNPTEWTKGNVTLTINAQDSLTGLAEKAYSFDGGETWQAENTKIYTKNTAEIIIKVKDKLDNIATYNEIEIDKISELEIQLKTYEEKQEGNNTYITNIAPDTTIREFKENIETNGIIEIYKGTQKITDIETNIGTGMTVKITLNKEQKEYTVVIKGDINGDGKAKLSDLSKLKLSVIGTAQLEGAYKEAADLNGDGNVKLSDLSRMKLYLVGKGSL